MWDPLSRIFQYRRHIIERNIFEKVLLTSVQSNLTKGRIAVLSPIAPAPHRGGSGPHLIGTIYPKRHLDRFSCYGTAHPYAQHADRHIEHATCDICSNMHWVKAMRPQKYVIMIGLKSIAMPLSTLPDKSIGHTSTNTNKCPK